MSEGKTEKFVLNGSKLPYFFLAFCGLAGGGVGSQFNSSGAMLARIEQRLDSLEKGISSINKLDDRLRELDREVATLKVLVKENKR